MQQVLGGTDQAVQQADQPCVQQAREGAAGPVELARKLVAAGNGATAALQDELLDRVLVGGVAHGEEPGDGKG